MRTRLLASVGIASLLVLGLPTAALAASETVVDAPGEPIMVDTGSITRPFQVASTGVVAKVTITVDFLSSSDETCAPPQGDRAYPNELGLTLTSPNNTVVLVSNEEPTTYNSQAGPERVEVTFDDSALAEVGSTNGGAPASGTFRPAEALSVFNGQTATGTWLLNFADNAGGDAKCYFGASLTIETGVPTTTSIASSSDSAAIGAPVTLTATVADEAPPALAARSALPPTGSVTFMEGTTTLGTAQLDATGAAAFSASFATAGVHLVTAVYAGDPDHVGSTSMEQEIDVYALPETTTTLTASNVSPKTGQAVTLTAAVDAVPVATATFVAPRAVTGTVQFLSGTTLLGEAAVIDGVANATFSFPTAGAQAITAMYSGDAAYAGSTSALVVVTVTAAPVTPAGTTPAKSLANTGSTTPPAGVILWGLGLAAAGLLTAFGARVARRTQA